MSEIKFNRQSSPVFDRLYQDAKDREKLKDPFALVKREDILEHSMLFEGNSDEEIEYDPNDDGIKRVQSGKTKVERVLGKIITEELKRHSGKPTINKSSRKIADKQLQKFADEQREQELQNEQRQGKLQHSPQTLISNLATKQAPKKPRQSASPQLFITLDNKTGKITERKTIVERAPSRKSTVKSTKKPKKTEKPKIQTHREIHSSGMTMPLKPKGQENDLLRTQSRKGTLARGSNDSNTASKKSQKKISKKDKEDQKNPIKVDLPSSVSTGSPRVQPAVARSPPPSSKPKVNPLQMSQIDREKWSQARKKAHEEDLQKKKEVEFANTCTFRPKIDRMVLTPPPPELSSQNSPRSTNCYSKKGQQSSVCTSPQTSPTRTVNTGTISGKPAFNPKTLFDPKRLIDSIDIQGFQMSNNVRVPPPNGLLYPENFKKRKVIARVFVKSRRQKPNYYESLTPSYRPIGYKTGCDIETMKGKSKPVFTFEESEIPGVKVIKGKQ